VSGLSGSKETAQSQVSVGMGLLAGSTVLLLTIIWGTCVIVGKCDIENSIAIDSRDTRGFSLTGMPFETVHYLNLNIKFGQPTSSFPKHEDCGVSSPFLSFKLSTFWSFPVKHCLYSVSM